MASGIISLSVFLEERGTCSVTGKSGPLAVNPLSLPQSTVNNESGSKLGIMHLNICGLATKYDSLSITLNETKVDVLCLSEHWCRKEELKLLHIEDFSLCAEFCRSVQTHGGVCVFARKDLSVRNIPYENSVEKIFEACIAVTKNLVKHNNLYIICIYRTPDSPIKEFLKELGLLLFKLYNKNDDFVICGDVNINLLQDNASRNDLLYLLLEYDIQPHIHQPTRVARLSSTCIDNIFSNLNTCASVSVKPVFYSDHTYQQCIFNFVDLSLEKSKSKFTYKRSLNDANMQTFYNAISLEDWEDMYRAEGFQDKFSAFYNTFLHHYNCHFPIRRTKIKNVGKKWFSKEIKDIHNLLCEMRPIEKRLNNNAYTEKYRGLLKLYKESISKCKKQKKQCKVGECWELVEGNLENS